MFVVVVVLFLATTRQTSVFEQAPIFALSSSSSKQPISGCCWSRFNFSFFFPMTWRQVGSYYHASWKGIAHGKRRWGNSVTWETMQIASLLLTMMLLMMPMLLHGIGQTIGAAFAFADGRKWLLLPWICFYVHKYKPAIQDQQPEERENCRSITPRSALLKR